MVCLLGVKGNEGKAYKVQNSIALKKIRFGRSGFGAAC